MFSPFDLWQIMRRIKNDVEKRYTQKTLFHRLIRLLFGNYIGMMIPLSICLFLVYQVAPVWVHHWVFEIAFLKAPMWIAGLLTLYVAFRFMRRYLFPQEGWKGYFSPIVGSSILASLMAATLVVLFAGGARYVQIYKDAHFKEIDVLPRVSNELVRYTPAQVAAEEIVRRTQTSQFTPGKTRPIGSSTGVAYIAPLVPQGLYNALFEHNTGFMYYDDGGTDEAAQRVKTLSSNPFQWGEGMEVLDDVYRQLIQKVGFLNTYPEIYYTPVYKEDGSVQEILGVVPYISYRFWWGLMIPQWGGVAIFHADGSVENLSPTKAAADERLIRTQRLFPEKLAETYIYSERYDVGNNILEQMWYGFIRRPGKIEIPDLPGEEQMPFFLPMQDGSYSYLATVEPDGEAFSLMRVYLINAKTGERQVYRYDKEGRPSNLQGPKKVISYVKALPNYVWHEGEGANASGTYRIIEPRPVTPDGRDRLFWMLSITPADYARVVATVFVDSATNQVYGPFTTRAQTFAWLQGKKIETAESTANDVEKMCAQIQVLWQNSCVNTQSRLVGANAQP